MTLTYKLDLDLVSANHRAEYLAQKLFYSKAIVWKQTRTI